MRILLALLLALPLVSGAEELPDRAGVTLLDHAAMLQAISDAGGDPADAEAWKVKLGDATALHAYLVALRKFARDRQESRARDWAPSLELLERAKTRFGGDVDAYVDYIGPGILNIARNSKPEDPIGFSLDCIDKDIRRAEARAADDARH